MNSFHSDIELLSVRSASASLDKRADCAGVFWGRFSALWLNNPSDSWRVQKCLKCWKWFFCLDLLTFRVCRKWFLFCVFYKTFLSASFTTGFAACEKTEKHQLQSRMFFKCRANAKIICVCWKRPSRQTPSVGRSRSVVLMSETAESFDRQKCETLAFVLVSVRNWAFNSL